MVEESLEFRGTKAGKIMDECTECISETNSKPKIQIFHIDKMK